MPKYSEYKQLNLPEIEKEIQTFWKEKGIFNKSVENRNGAKPFIFYEGPPSANGTPGIHHVMARTIKDIFCRYKTLKGFQVKRKGGWDTHGLPIELQVEKTLGITKDDIGKKISVADYNAACKKDVMKFKGVWDDLTEKMGYWVDLEHPYITYDNNYIETLWHLLKQLYQKGLLYKGYSIQPYSPAAGTGLSSHELNQPGCYRNVKDTSAIAQFKAINDGSEKCTNIFADAFGDVFFLAWTTTPWTLPSNTALAIGKNIIYRRIKTFNPYTFQPITIVLADDLVSKYFKHDQLDLKIYEYKAGDKIIPADLAGTFSAADLEGLRYEQLLPYTQPTDGDAFKIVIGDFVTTEDGTGIVHLAPSFGADDFRTAKKFGLGSLTLVDRQGRFTDEVTDFAGEFVKEAFLSDEEKETERKKQGRDKYLSVDERISIKLKQENKAFKVEKYEHNYPHCWRTDKPVLYYPLDSWFVKTTAAKERLVELNKTINWKPESTGTGRFGNWLENLQDWNLSRSRFWGTPLPIWRNKVGSKEMCIGSVEELKAEMAKAKKAGITNKENIEDLHRPYVDEIVLVTDDGEKLYRETDLIDVWFDSGAMPYAQWHFPFENTEEFKNSFPADFIAEGVDQTRGWFFTLHAIAGMLFDSVAFKTVVSNGLVLDKNGNKMSKSKGNTVDPFGTINKYGADAPRWYMVSNAQPWDNLKFDIEGVVEVQRKFFGTLFNVYSFFALYANIDGFTYKEAEVPLEERPEIDRWIISLLNSLINEVDASLNEYEATRAARAIQSFVTEDLSNWYVRLCRRRFWKGDYSTDKIAAYQTLYTCMEVVAKLMSSIAPFYSEKLFNDLNRASGKTNVESVHLTNFPIANPSLINPELEEQMRLAQQISSMVLSIRKKMEIKVRQPLQKVLIPVLDPALKSNCEHVKSLILSEVNVKEMEFIDDTSGLLVKKIKPNFRVLGKKAGSRMKALADLITNMDQAAIAAFEREGKYQLSVENETFTIESEDADILSEDIPGWQVTSEGRLTVALDVNISQDLYYEGLARELVSKLQNHRKESNLEVTDKIKVEISPEPTLNEVVNKFYDYICSEILATQIVFVEEVRDAKDVEIENINVKINITKS